MLWVFAASHTQPGKGQTMNQATITTALQSYWERCLTAQRAADDASTDPLGAALVDTRPTADEARDLAVYLAEVKQ